MPVPTGTTLTFCRRFPLSADVPIVLGMDPRVTESMTWTRHDFMTDQLHGSSACQRQAMAFLPCHWSRHLNHSRAILNHGKISWSRWTFVRAGSTQLPLVERKPLMLKASEFQHLFEEGPTERIYAGTPVSGLGITQQGKVGELWARDVLQEQNPGTKISEPELGICCNGRRRGSNMTSYDFRLGSRRVEIKSSRMTWTSAKGLRLRSFWSLQFANVKLPYGKRPEAAFDDLYLVIMSPWGLHLIQHDAVTGVCTCGKTTEVGGHMIRVNGSVSAHSWDDALDEILHKLCVRGACKVLDEKPLSALDLKKILGQTVSPGRAVAAKIPMYSMSVGKRGKRIQEVGHAIDRRLHPHCVFSLEEGNCGQANAPADWVRDTIRVELKSCGLTFDRSNNLWRCFFQRIKPGLFDELWLAIYTSVGIHYYRSTSCESLSLCNAGAAMKIHGHLLIFYGPQGELDPFKAFKVIEAKIISRGCKPVAIVEWGTGSSTPHTECVRKRWPRSCHSVLQCRFLLQCTRP